jgi:uncharacterized repeat protein (TIGR01451 family)
MRTAARRARGAIVLVALTVALVAGQGAAAAAVVVTGATIEGSTSVSTPPGGVMAADVTAAITGSSTWSATRARIGADAACVDHGDVSGPGTRSRTFDVTAPGTPGEYDAGFTASTSRDCAAGTGAEKVLPHAVRVTTPGPNPDLEPVCGIDVMLVLDESGSIGANAQKVRDAARAFLDALSGTGSAVSIVDFSTTAAQQVPYTTVTADSIADVFAPYLKNGYVPNGWTNWEAAFQVVKQANARPGGPKADTVFFITDGDPTAHNTATGTVTGLTGGDVTALRRAVAEADLVKEQGSHVLAMGVGAAVTNEASARRLTAISGFDRYPVPQGDLGKADYTLIQDFDDLAAALRAFAVALCQASVTVTKLVDEGDGTYRPDPGWEITATVSTSPGSYTWVKPPEPPAPGPRTLVTDEDGVATFQWKPKDPTATSQVTLQEERRPGYEAGAWVCEKNAPGRTRKRTTRGTGLRLATGTLGPNEYARCTLRNRILPGTIEIEKRATPQTGQEFGFVGSPPLGAFSLVDDGADGPSSRTFTGLAPGTYTVSEQLPAGWELTGIACSDPAVAISGSQVTIPLGPAAAVVCTYSDRRADSPIPPEPPTPPTPPDPETGGGPEPVPPPPSTRLRIVKVTRAVARVGGRVPFALRVRNVGSVTAEDVRLTDIPPAAMSLTSLRASAGAKRVRGNAVWRLGDLAPGASRVIRGVVRIDSAAPGLKTNTALATAVNAALVQAQTNTRVLARRFAVRPAVTG